MVRKCVNGVVRRSCAVSGLERPMVKLGSRPERETVVAFSDLLFCDTSTTDV